MTDGATGQGAEWIADVRRARDLVLTYGWNATAYQIVNPGIRHWFAADGEAVIGYVRHAGVRVVAGAPVCALARLPDVVTEFERRSAAAGDNVCYFGAESRLETVLRDVGGHAFLGLGAQPAWRPDAFVATVRSRASLRGQVNRARNKHVVVGEWACERATGSAELRRLLGEWLGTRGLPPLHFLVEPDTLDQLTDRRVFVAMRDDVALGFVVLSPVPARSGWLIEQFVRGRSAPNGIIESLLLAAVERVASEGATYVTLGLAPLSRNGPPHDADPALVRLVLAWLRVHGRRFYNFDGLDAFKSKFAPERWEPVYAIARGRRFPLRALWAIAGAFGGCSPLTLGLRTLARAVGQEGRWLRGVNGRVDKSA